MVIQCSPRMALVWYLTSQLLCRCTMEVYFKEGTTVDTNEARMQDIEEIKPSPRCHSSLGEEHSNVGIRLSLHTFYMKLRPVASTCCLCYMHLSGLVRLKFH